MTSPSTVLAASAIEAFDRLSVMPSADDWLDALGVAPVVAEAPGVCVL